MRTIPKTTTREGKGYRLRSREGSFAIYEETKGAGFLLSRITAVPERPFRYTGKAAHERLWRRGDNAGGGFTFYVLPTLADAEARLKAEAAWDEQCRAESEILKRGGYPARKLRQQIRARDAALEAETQPQPNYSIIDTMPQPSREDARQHFGRADACLLIGSRFYLPA